MQNDPDFQTFMANNSGKSPQEIAREHGINLSDYVDQDGKINTVKLMSLLMSRS